MKRGDQGAAVQRLQLALLRHGYELPKFGADGDFGGETVRALLDLAKDANVIWPQSGEVPESLLDELGIGEIDDVVPTAAEDLDNFDLEGVKLYDHRGLQSNPHPKATVDRHGRTVMRDPSAVDGICLHQAGCHFDPPRDWEEEFASFDDALASRALNVACHAMAFRNGTLVIPADPLARISQANGLNGRTLGLEVDGLFPGLVSKRRPEHNEVTVELVHAARMGVKLLKHLGEAAGCIIQWIWAHRQADAWRQADPGEELWRKVVLEYAVPVLGLRTRPGETFAHHKGPKRRGMPIPKVWDPAGVGKY